MRLDLALMNIDTLPLASFLFLCTRSLRRTKIFEMKREKEPLDAGKALCESGEGMLFAPTSTIS